MFRNLRADEIECRIGNVKNKQDATQGYSLLLYKAPKNKPLGA